MRLKDGRKSATIVCPKGHYGSLEEHEITKSGFVEPSVVCHDDACDFHAKIMLGGWS